MISLIVVVVFEFELKNKKRLIEKETDWLK